MFCETCRREMIPLFISYACNYCDGREDWSKYDRGFIVWRGRPPGSEEYVFRTRQDAERWKALNGLAGCPVREVCTESRFSWFKSRGTIRDLELADHTFEIYADHKFEPGPFRAFLIPA